MLMAEVITGDDDDNGAESRGSFYKLRLRRLKLQYHHKET